jgi:hypothetical protein
VEFLERSRRLQQCFLGSTFRFSDLHVSGGLMLGERQNVTTAGDPERGCDIWATGGAVIDEAGCSYCDSVDGSEQTDEILVLASSWLGISKQAGDRIPGMSAEEYLRKSILSPSTFIVEGHEDRMGSDSDSASGTHAFADDAIVDDTHVGIHHCRLPRPLDSAYHPSSDQPDPDRRYRRYRRKDHALPETQLAV